MSIFSTTGGSPPATGKQLLDASWAMLRQDRELLWLPALASITGLLAAALFFLPGFALGWFAGGDGNRTWGIYVGGVLAGFAASVVAIYFQAALVIGANQRADGSDPTLRGVLREAATRRKEILAWAALTSSVGVVIRAIEERLGVLGNILGFLGGLAWAIASFLVIPVLVAENLGPVAAVKRSSELIRATWGTGLRTTLRFGLLQILYFLPPTLLVAIGISVASGSGAAVKIVGSVIAVVGFAAVLALAMIFSAISSYSRALIYRYATQRPIPNVDPSVFAGVFRTKRRRRGLFA